MADVEEVWATALVDRLLEEGHLELSSARSKSGVVANVAFHLGARAEPRASVLAEALLDHKGVAELSCDDEELAALVAATRPSDEAVARAAKPSSEGPQGGSAEATTRSLDRLEPDLRAAVERATAHAWGRGHAEVTLDHVLLQVLGIPSVVELARRRGGHPEDALAECTKRLARQGTHQGDVGPDRALLSALDEAEDAVPRFVAVGDLAIAAMRPAIGVPHAGFLRAFQPEPERAAPPAELADDADIGPVPALSRGPGALATSDELRQALALYRGEAERHADPFRLGRSRTVSLPARWVVDVERELGTTLPDDLWAVLAARVLAVAELGIGAAMPHGEPAVGGELCERILTVASGGEAHVDDDLVAIAELDDDPDGSLLCVKRGVVYADRNAQEVVRVDDAGRRPLGTFGAFLLARAREASDAKPMEAGLRACLT
jgi:hypothetical protein